MTEKQSLPSAAASSVAVIGAGHAGIEAALASARMGVDTVLFTMSLDAVANLPCNPSIGGTAKGHLVYEIDAEVAQIKLASMNAAIDHLSEEQRIYLSKVE